MTFPTLLFLVLAVLNYQASSSTDLFHLFRSGRDRDVASKSPPQEKPTTSSLERLHTKEHTGLFTSSLNLHEKERNSGIEESNTDGDFATDGVVRMYEAVTSKEIIFLNETLGDNVTVTTPAPIDNTTVAPATEKPLTNANATSDGVDENNSSMTYDTTETSNMTNTIIDETNNTFAQGSGPLSIEQFDQCIQDLLSSDSNNDSRLSSSEYVNFLLLNSASNGYGQYLSGDNLTLSSFPLNFPLVFHSTACMCAMDSVDGEEDCCVGEKEHVKIYYDQSYFNQTDQSSRRTGLTSLGMIRIVGGTEGVVIVSPTSDENGTSGGNNDDVVEIATTTKASISTDEEIYTRRFCTETFYSYNATKTPTEAPTTYAPSFPISVDSPSPTTMNVTMFPTEFSSIINVPTSSSQPVYTSLEPSTGKEPTSSVSPVIVSIQPSVIVPITSAPTMNSIKPTAAVSITSLSPVIVSIKPSIAVPTTSMSPVIKSFQPSATMSATTESPVITSSGPSSVNPTILSGVPSLVSTGTYSPVISLSSAPTIVENVTSVFPSTVSPNASIPIIMPTSQPSVIFPTTQKPSAGASSRQLSVPIQYGISSNCGVMASDVLSGEGNSIIDGLLSASEVIVVDILNATFPRGDNVSTSDTSNVTEAAVREAEAHKIFNSGSPIKIKPTDASMVLDAFNGEKEKNTGEGEDHVNDETNRNSDDHTSNSNKKKTKKKKKKKNQSRNKGDQSVNDRALLNALTGNMLLPRASSFFYHRSLVYYSDNNPIIITDVQDVQDDSCPPGENCMSVFSTVYVTLEEGDDEFIITNEIQNGIKASFDDGSFFQAIPPDTVLCPGETAPPKSTSPNSTEPTTIPLSAPTSSIVPSVVTKLNITALPTAGNVTLPPSTAAMTLPPSPNLSSFIPTKMPAASTSNVTAAPSIKSNLSSSSFSPVAVTTAPSLPIGSPTPTYLSSLQTPGSLIPSTGGTQLSTSTNSSLNSSVDNEILKTEITYDISNDCGLDSQAVMNGVDNTLKAGLIEATTLTAVRILNETFPQVNDVSPSRRGNKAQRLMIRISDNIQTHSSRRVRVKGKTMQTKIESTKSLRSTSNSRRNLVYYTDENPVTIDRIIDTDTDCPEGNNCLLIISTISTVLQAGDDSDAVNEALISGVSDSFQDGSFYENLPADTVICPGRR